MTSNNARKEKKIDFNYNFRMYYGFLKKYKAAFIFLMALILLTETAYVADKFLFKTLVDDATEFANNALGLNDYVETLLIIAGIFLILLAFKAASKWLQMHLINRVESSMIIDVKRRFFNHVLHLSYNFHTTHKTGSLISRLVRGGSAVERMSDVIVFNFAPVTFQLIAVGASLAYFDRDSAAITFAVVIVFLAYNLIINEIQKKSNAEANRAEDVEKANISDIFTNIESIKYFGKENSIKSRYAKLSEATKEAFLRNWNYFRWLDLGQTLIIGLGTFFIIYFSMIKFLDGKMTVGILVFIYTTYGSIFGNLFGFVHGIRNFYKAMADFDPLFKYAKLQNEIKDKAFAREMKIRHGAIEFRNVSFSYGKRSILHNFSLKIPKNKKIALVGHSGCGKSTIIKLLYRFYDVDSGEILIDYKNIKDFKQESLRSELSIVPQECILFDDTIYNNVAFSRPDADKKEVMKAIRFAQLDKIISKFPNKEKTIVGERGVKLSGGEKQRVSIARAILADKKILVLDEATSSLDSKTEHEIQLNLEKLMVGRTAIIIAHRISTIINADAIIVMDKGKIMQKGTHKELVNQEGQYKNLWDLQKGGYLKQ